MAKPTIQTGVNTAPTVKQLEAQARANSPVDAQAFSEEFAAAQEREATGTTPVPEPAPSFTDRLSQVAEGFGIVRAPHYRRVFGINERDKQVMTWRLPNGSSVQMYINPQNFIVKESFCL